MLHRMDGKISEKAVLIISRKITIKDVVCRSLAQLEGFIFKVDLSCFRTARDRCVRLVEWIYAGR